MEQKGVTVWAARLICLAFALAALYWFGSYGLSIAMPFLLGGAVAMLVQPAANKLARWTGLGQGLCKITVLILLGGALGGAGYLAVYSLWREAVEFYSWLQANADSVVSAIGGLFSTEQGGISLPIFIEKLLELPLIADFFGGLDSLAHTMTSSLLAKLGQALTGAAMNAATGVPSALLSVLVFFLSCFYLSMDGARLFEWTLGCLPKQARPRVRGICDDVLQALRGYLRAYGLIFCLTLAEMVVGLHIVGVRYAFLIAVLVAAVDILPVLGSGALLVPWSAVALLSRDVRTGVGLLVLWGVVTLVRQVAEPKIVGNSLGLHPLAALASMYVCFRLFGAVGLILGPCAAIVGKVILRRSRSDIAKESQ